jgi:DNA-binding GntR family transcriptional regulator
MIATATAFDFAFRLKASSAVHGSLASLRHSLDEHRAVAEAIEARDGEAAEAIMRRHIASRASAYLAIAARSPEVAAAQP